MLRIVLAIVWVAIAGFTLAMGREYYLTPVADRAFDPVHEVLAPHAFVGHGYGVIGSSMMLIGVIGYSLRKRVKKLRRVGKLKDWLDVHIFLCTLGPFLVLLHTSFKFGGIISIAFWSMTVVVLSGVFGRYVYAHIPKTVHGQFLTLQAVSERRAELAKQIHERLGPGVLERALPVAPDVNGRSPGLLASIGLAFRNDLTHRSEKRRISAALRAAGVPAAKRRMVSRTLREESRLRQQVLLLKPFQQLFHYWHVLHLPLAIVMFMILILHVAVAVAFGYGWVFG